MNYISLNELLQLEDEFGKPDYSEAVKQAPYTELNISGKYGTGRIFTSPLISGAGLVVMEACFKDDIEIYSEDTCQQQISMTVCVNGSFTSSCQHTNLLSIKQHETSFVRYQDVQQNISSSFKANEKNCFVTIQLSKDWLQTEDQHASLDFILDPFWQGVYNSGQASQLMLSVAHEIVAMSQQDRFQYQLISSKALQLWSHQIKLLERLSNSSQTNQRLKAQDIAAIHQAAAILVAEIDQPPSLLQLAHRVCINDNKLKKGFKQIYGMTAFSYLQQQRLEKAKSLLTQHDLKISEVASMVGFKSTSHFSKIFRLKFGIAPNRFNQSA